MNINEKIALYEFCRSITRKDYYNLPYDKKLTITTEYQKLKAAEHPAVKARWN